MKKGKEFILPNWTLCPIANDDWGGCTDEEQKLLTEFMDEHGCLYIGEDLGFCHNNDLDRYASDCHEVFTLEKD